MNLVELQDNWNRFGQADPLWAILTSPEKAGNRWDVHEFFQTGVDDVHDIFDHLAPFGVPRSRNFALDFGCGVGRLTQALCKHFEHCCGVDIAPSMIQRATEYNQFGSRCDYIVNEVAGLPQFESESADFIYCKLVLQHMRPEYSRHYIAEFLRVLAPNGALVFQLPSEVRPAESPGEVTDTVLPDSGFAAGLFPDRGSITAQQGSPIALKVLVRNTSSSDWPSAKENPTYPIQLGNHWVAEGGEVLVLDDSRSALTHKLRPREETEFTLMVNAPERPGQYVLELDMVQEQIAWFAAKGSEIARIDVRVTVDPARGRDESESPHDGIIRLHANDATMEMYGVPKQEVLDLIARGGELLKLERDFCAGPEWNSYLYFVTKSR